MPLDHRDFIQRWQAADRSERSNAQSFVKELCDLLDVEHPQASGEDYVFERRVSFAERDGGSRNGYIDCYRRDAFVLEAKSIAAAEATQGWDSRMQRALNQAQAYVRALPADEGRPPFILLLDVHGGLLELYAEFSRSGGYYIPYPDPRSHRIRLDDLANEQIRDTLRTVWLDALSLDPARRSARVTREIATQLARLAKSLEAAGHQPDNVAAFLMRCLFTMFAEDVGLLPERAFTRLLEETRAQPELLPRLLPGLWQAMNHGGFSAEIRADVLRFNGGLFAEPSTLPLNAEQIELLIAAARADWRHVEPAIFGTLLERALDPHERHRLGAHYTPRAYVERLVMPTVIEPLREEWTANLGAALDLDRRGKRGKAIEQIRDFHHRLCQVRVLDPACGSGNFLYVTLEHLKRLEGEVLNTLEELGYSQGVLELAGVTVDPHQMLGLETNPRAARIAEAVLWIGYLQWHFRTRGNVNPPEPVLKDFHNIENRDAVLAWDKVELVLDAQGVPVSRWDGITMKTHPVTGRQVPDENARVSLERYLNPRKAGWPEAEFVVGNPPFIGTARMRQALGDGYAAALRQTYPQVPESADFVMYWWHHAADLTRDGRLRRFGFITTNSLRQTFNRRVIQHHLEQKKPLSLVFAIPDHPWVDSADGAAVRIAMSVGEALPSAAGRAAGGEGVLVTVIAESEGDGEGRDVRLAEQVGRLHADLKVGANISAAVSLASDADLSSPGMKLHGSGFIVTPKEAEQLGLGRIAGLERHIRDYRNGKDLTQKPRGVLVIDLFGLSAEEVRSRYPEVCQWVVERVRPEREAKGQSKDGAGYARLWWLFGKPRQELREALNGLPRYIATVETSKHRFFTFLDRSILPDNMLVNIAVDDAYPLGVLSSRVHVAWALAMGGTLEDRPRYNKTRCFETFPFPAVNKGVFSTIRQLAEQLDAHRKRQQALHPELTLTGMYNVLEKLRKMDNGAAPLPDDGEGERLPDDPSNGIALSAKERVIHEQGLVSVLGQLHDELDTAVFAAYGWSDLAPKLVGKPGGTTPYPDKPAGQAKAEEELLQRLVDLNAERAAEEARGIVRWLRPEFQNPGGEQAVPETGVGGRSDFEVRSDSDTTTGKLAWPKTLAEQVQAVRDALAAQPAELSAEQLARQFKRAQTKRVAELLDTLVALGQVDSDTSGQYRIH